MQKYSTGASPWPRRLSLTAPSSHRPAPLPLAQSPRGEDDALFDHAVLQRTCQALGDSPQARAAMGNLGFLMEVDDDPCAHRAIDDVLRRIVWLVERGEPIGNALSTLEHMPVLDTTTLHHLASRLQHSIESGWEHTLNACQTRVPAGSNPFDARWAQATQERRQCLALANALVDADGLCDRTAIGTIDTWLAADAPLAGVSARLRENGLALLTQLRDPLSALAPLLDELSSIEPVHPDAQALLAMDCGKPDPDRRERAAAALGALLSPVRQRLGMRNCTRITLKMRRQTTDSAQTVRDLIHWFRTGGIASPRGTASVTTPPELPVHRLTILSEPFRGTPQDLAQCTVAIAVTSALQHHVPASSGAYWRQMAVEAALRLHECQDGTRSGCLDDWLTALLLDHQQLSLEDLDPAHPPGPPRQDRVQEYRRLRQLCLGFLASQTGSPLLLAWQNTVSSSGAARLKSGCWQAIECMPIDGERPATPLLDDVLDALKADFFDASSVQLDPPEWVRETGVRGMRLFIRHPGVDAPPVPITGLRSLAAGMIALVDALALPRADPEEFASCQRWLVGQFLREDLEPAAPEDDVHSPYCSVWWSDLEETRSADPTEHTPGQLCHVVNKRRWGAPLGFSEIELASGVWRWYRDERQNARADAAERSLRRVLKFLRYLDRNASQDLHATLGAQHGRLVLKSGGHVQHLLPASPSLESGWHHAVAPRSAWIRDQLITPSHQRLLTPVDPDDAEDFVNDILRSDQLPGTTADKRQTWVQRVLQHGVRQKAFHWQSLVQALKAVLISEDARTLWVDPSHALEQLDIAVLKHPKIALPAVVYADTNWENADALVYMYSPLHGRIAHYCAFSGRSLQQAQLQVVSPIKLYV